MNVAARITLVWVFVLLSLVPGFGEIINKPEDIKEGSRFHRFFMSNLPMIVNKPGVPQICKMLDIDPEKSSRIHIVVFEPIDFPESASSPQKGKWLLKYSVPAKNGRMFTFNFTCLLQNGLLLSDKGLMGNSIASDILIKDVSPQVIRAAEAKYPTPDQSFTKNAVIVDAAVTVLPHDISGPHGVIKGAWEEQWIVVSMGRAVPLRIQFLPDGNGSGTTYNIGY